MQSTQIRAVSSCGYVKLSAMDGAHLVEQARQIHHTTSLATAALGRTLMGASLLGSQMKQEKASITLRLNGGGPMGTVLCVSDHLGNARGYVQNPSLDLPRRTDGKLAVGASIGINGDLTVIRDVGVGEPYTGSVPLVSGEVAEDLAAYLVDSEQIGAAVALGVLIGRDSTVQAAGGFIVALLPGADDDVLGKLEENIQTLGDVSAALDKADLETLVQNVMDGFSPKILERTTVDYHCPCSKERVLRAIGTLQPAEITEMIAAGEALEVTCQFCDKIQTVSVGELEALGNV